MKRLLFFILIGLALTSCYYDNEEKLYPKLSFECDTTAVSLSGTIKPILQTSCLSCHSSSQAAAFGGAVDLEDYSSLQQIALGGNLLGSISHSEGFSPMPKGGGKLDACSIKQVGIWIGQGAPNN